MTDLIWVAAIDSLKRFSYQNYSTLLKPCQWQKLLFIGLKGVYGKPGTPEQPESALFSQMGSHANNGDYKDSTVE